MKQTVNDSLAVGNPHVVLPYSQTLVSENCEVDVNLMLWVLPGALFVRVQGVACFPSHCHSLVTLRSEVKWTHSSSSSAWLSRCLALTRYMFVWGWQNSWDDVLQHLLLSQMQPVLFEHLLNCFGIYRFIIKCCYYVYHVIMKIYISCLHMHLLVFL